MADPPVGFEKAVQYQGDPWVLLMTMPRIVAESYRRLLAESGVVTVIRGPPSGGVVGGGCSTDASAIGPSAAIPRAASRASNSVTAQA